MTDSTGQNGRTHASRQALRAGVLLVVMALLFGGWSFAWYYGADALRAAAEQALTKLASGGQEATCENLAVKGFPFRIGIFCDRVQVSRKGQPSDGDWRIEAGGLRTAAQLYNPGKIVLELDGPVVFEGDKLPSLTAKWANARASLRLGFDGPKRISAVARSLALTLFAARPLVEAKDAEIHLRPAANGNLQDVDLAFSTNEAAISYPQPVPAFNARIDGRIDAIAGLAQTQLRSVADLRHYLRDNGIKGEARSVILEPVAGGRFAFSGPFEIGGDGLLSARLAISVGDPSALMRFVSAMLPAGSPALEYAGEIEAVLNLASAVGNAAQITLLIDNGEISAGIFSLGHIPKLF